MSIAGKRRSYDIFNGGDGLDTLTGTDSADAILLDDNSGSVQSPRLSSIEIINARGGDDVVDLTSTRYGYGNVTINGGSGNDTLWSSAGNDVLRGESGNDVMDGGAGNDFLDGGSGRDDLNGGAGVDVLQGGAGDDTLRDRSGGGVLDGGSGSDVLRSGRNNSLLIGGTGNDTIRLGGGADVVAFNRGDGRDTVQSNGGSATLSLGAGIRIQDLAFRRSGANLILDTGNNESITFQDWYSGARYQSVAKLQLVTQGMTGPAALMHDKVEEFNFQGLVGRFDGTRGVSKWALTNGLAAFALGGSNTEAIGGDLAYAYGTAGSLAGIALNAAQDVAGASGFGSEAQVLHPSASLKQGTVKLV